MYIKEPDNLSKEEYLSEIIPFFEDVKSELLFILGKDKDWAEFLAGVHLVYIDNSQEKKESHLYLSKTIRENTFLTKSEPIEMYYGSYSEGYLGGYFARKDVLNCLRNVFVEKLLSLATPTQIGDYVQQLLKLNYRIVEQIVEPNFLCFQVSHFQFSESFFSIAASKMNIIIPLDDTLDALQLMSNNKFICKSSNALNILFTNKNNLDDYKGFNQMLNLRHLTSHFYRQGFILGISLFRQILGTTYDNTFKIIDLLKTSSSNQIYQMKKRLVRLETSKGKIFEQYIRQFLEICFQPHFEELTIKEQVPNEGRLRIRDFIIINSKSSSYFLKFLKEKGADCLLFDAKNYRAKLNTRDIDTFQMYLEENPFFGNVGIILSRNGVSKNCKKNIIKSLPKRKILVLNQDDLLRMLDYIDAGKDAIEVIQIKYHDLLLEM